MKIFLFGFGSFLIFLTSFQKLYVNTESKNDLTFTFENAKKFWQFLLVHSFCLLVGFFYLFSFCYVGFSCDFCFV